MKVNIKSFILVLLIFTVPEVKCGEVTFKIEKIGEREIKRFSVVIRHGIVTDADMKIEDNFEISNFVCLEENHSIELIIYEEKQETFQIIVNKSFDLERYTEHDLDNAIKEFAGKRKVCFFNSYFVKKVSTVNDKAELYLKFIKDETSFDFTKILSLYVIMSNGDIFAVLKSIEDEYAKDIRKLQNDYVAVTLAAESLIREENNTNTIVNLNGQALKFESTGILSVYFIDPNYLPNSTNKNIYFSKSENPQGKLEMTFKRNELNIIFPDKNSYI